MRMPQWAALAAATAVLAMTSGAQAEDGKGITQPELNYQAGTSPLANEPMYQSTNPKAPKMTQAEFEKARDRKSVV